MYYMPEKDDWIKKHVRKILKHDKEKTFNKKETELQSMSALPVAGQLSSVYDAQPCPPSIWMHSPVS